MNQCTDIFKRHYSSWSPEDKANVSYFLLSNQFISKFYHQEIFDQLCSLIIYKQIRSGEKVWMDRQNKPEMIIQLKGSLQINKKIITESKNKNTEGQNQLKKSIAFVTHAILKSYGQSIRVNEDCFVEIDQENMKLNQEGISQFLFIPEIRLKMVLDQVEKGKNMNMMIVLKRIFPEATKRQLSGLIEAGSSLKEFRMYNLIYRVDEMADGVYILLEGNVKIEEASYFQRKKAEVMILAPEIIFGQKDVDEERRSTATCWSAVAKVIHIPKMAYFKFKANNSELPESERGRKYKQNARISKKVSESLMSNKRSISNELKLLHELRSQKNRSNLDQRLNMRQSNKLPAINNSFRVEQFGKSQNEEDEEYRLIKNSHKLLDSYSRKNRKIGEKETNDAFPRDVFKEKLLFYKRLRPQGFQLDLDHRII